MNNSINEQLENLKIEDLIWIIYFFLAIASIISNQYERSSLLKNNRRFNSTSKKINVTIFIITFFIYLYFAYINWQDIENIKKGHLTDNSRNILASQARLIAALLFLVGGTIYLITETQSSDSNEIGFI